MAITTITDFSFLNHQIQAQEQVENYLWKLQTLLGIAAAADSFFDFSKAIQQNYLSIVSDFVEEAIQANQNSLNELLKQEANYKDNFSDDLDF